MALNGKYELVKDEGHAEHLIAIGFAEDKVKALAAGTVSLEIQIDGNQVTLIKGHGQRKNVYKLGEETDETAPDGRALKTTASLNGDVLTVVRKAESGEWKQVYTVSGSELTVVSTASKAGVPEGKSIFKKL